MVENYIIKGRGSSRNSSIKACLKKYGNIACTVKHIKNNAYKIIFDFDDSDQAAEVIEKAGGLVLAKSSRKLIISFTPRITSVVTLEDGNINVPQEIIEELNLKHGMSLVWQMVYEGEEFKIYLKPVENNAELYEE